MFSRQTEGLERWTEFLLHAANGPYGFGPLGLRRPACRRRRNPEHILGLTHGLPLQPSPLLAKSSIQLFPVSQLDRLHCARSIDPPSRDSALEQKSALPCLRPRLSRTFSGATL